MPTNKQTAEIPQLPDISRLSKVPAEVHFGVVCDFGVEILRYYTASNSLPNIQVALSTAARKFRVLNKTADAGSTDESENEYTFRNRLRSRVEPYAFQADKGWKDSNSLDRARNFCKNVGSQLWYNYIIKKNFEQSSWPESRVNLCALGMESLGLTFAFPHSVPKASLPLLWARGKVTAYSTSLNWLPLFPNADS